MLRRSVVVVFFRVARRFVLVLRPSSSAILFLPLILLSAGQVRFRGLFVRSETGDVAVIFLIHPLFALLLCLLPICMFRISQKSFLNLFFSLTILS